MNKRQAVMLVTLAGLTAASWAQAASSSPVLIDATSKYKNWSTVTTNAVPLRWSWNANATHARLDVVGMNGTFSTNFEGAVSNWLWRVSEAGSPPAEDVYALTLTFLAPGDSVVGALTSRLAVVKGALGSAVVDAVPGSRSWVRIGADAVIPYDGGWSNVSADAAFATLEIAKTGGVAQSLTLDAGSAGYYGWKVRNNGWGYGTFTLTLGFPGSNVEWQAVLERPIDGTAVSIR